MNKITSVEELERISAECEKKMSEKIKGEDHKRHIVLCGGTGCLSSNSRDIAAKFTELLAKKGLNEKATVNMSGCFGFCSQGPFVKIYPEDTLYRMVTLDDVEEIIDSDIGRGEVVERLLYVDPVSGEKVSKQDEINFYKKQRRIGRRSVYDTYRCRRTCRSCHSTYRNHTPCGASRTKRTCGR